jgi:hypothetical protein
VSLGGGAAAAAAAAGTASNEQQQRWDDDGDVGGYPGAHLQGRQELGVASWEGPSGDESGDGVDTDRDLSISLVFPEAAWLERRHAARSAGLYKLNAGEQDLPAEQDPPSSSSRREIVAASAACIFAASSASSCAGPASAGVLSAALGNNGGTFGGLVEYDSPELDYSFKHPKGWKSLRNHLRRGVIVADFSSNDKAFVEVFSAPPRDELRGAAGGAAVSGDGGEMEEEGGAVGTSVVGVGGEGGEGDEGGAASASALASRARREAERLVIRARAVAMLVAPVDNDNSGDSKLEMPAMRNVKDLSFGGGSGDTASGGGGGEGEGTTTDTAQTLSTTYDYFTFTSDTTTRSGYQVTRWGSAG